MAPAPATGHVGAVADLLEICSCAVSPVLLSLSYAVVMVGDPAVWVELLPPPREPIADYSHLNIPYFRFGSFHSRCPDLLCPEPFHSIRGGCLSSSILLVVGFLD